MTARAGLDRSDSSQGFAVAASDAASPVRELRLGLVPEFRSRASQVGERVADVARPSGLVPGRQAAARDLPNRCRELVHRDAAAAGHVVDPAAGGRRRGGREEVRLDRICHESEIATLLPVAVDDRALAPKTRLEEARNHGRVGPFGILSRTEDVEVPQADQLHPVTASEHVRELLVHPLRKRIGRQRPSFLPFAFRERLAVSVNARRRGVDDPT